MTRIYLHALGGGHGHLRRALGLSRALRARNAEVLVGVPADHPGRAALRSAGIPTLGLTRAAPRPTRARIGPRDAFVVDALPRGVVGELEDLDTGSCPRVLIRRLLRNPAGTEKYSRVIDVEPVEKGRGFGPVIAPSLQPAAAEVILVGGDPALDAFLRRLAARLHRAGVEASLHCRRRGLGGTSPLEPVGLRGARCVVGAAGYHLVHEARAVGVHHLALPRPRRFDDQHTRARAFARTPSSPEDLLRVLAEICSGHIEPRQPEPTRSFTELAEDLLSALESPR
ncbi:MAG: hypothetical protein AAFZ18_34900 [Myxococcota bacterium]